jgi:peptide/nickel transport system permease protein
VIAFLIRRLIQAVTVLLAVSVITFGLFFLVPKLTGSDPATLFAGRLTNPEALAGIRTKLGLNHSLLQQYWDYLGGFFHARQFNDGPDKTTCPWPCLGYSFKNDQSVGHLIADRFPITLSLAIGAPIIWLVVGVSVGRLSALRPRSLGDRASMLVALAAISLPVYFTAAVLRLFVVYNWHWLPEINYVGFTNNPLLWAKNLILPWISLATLYAASYARFTRASMLDVLNEDYIRTARAKGLAERTVINRHAMRPVGTLIITLFGMDVGALLGGAILTESVFSLPGLGKLGYDAISQHDLPIIMGVTILAAFFIVAANVVVDMLYAVIDPRVRLS